MTKLLDKSGNIVDVPAGQVADAIGSGQFQFPSNRNIPIVQGGTAKWVDPNFAAQYYKRLTFTDDDTVQQQQAEERTRGIGGAAAALAYGATKSATLGLAPLAIGAVSDTARDYMRDLELGRPSLTTTGEVAGLFVDPFALGGRGAARAAEGGVARLAEGEAGAASRMLPPGPAAADVTAKAPQEFVFSGPAAQAARRRRAADYAEAQRIEEDWLSKGEWTKPRMTKAYALPEAETAAAEPLSLGAQPYRKPTLTRIGEEAPEAAAIREQMGIPMEPGVPAAPPPTRPRAPTALPPGPAPEPPVDISRRLGGLLGTGEAELSIGRARRAAPPSPPAPEPMSRGLQLPPSGREPLVTPVDVNVPAADLTGFRPAEGARVPLVERGPVSDAAALMAPGEVESFAAEYSDAPKRIREAIKQDRELTSPWVKEEASINPYDEPLQAPAPNKSGLAITYRPLGIEPASVPSKSKYGGYRIDSLSLIGSADEGLAAEYGNPRQLARQLLDESGVESKRLEQLLDQGRERSLFVNWDIEAAKKAGEAMLPPDPNGRFWRISNLSPAKAAEKGGPKYLKWSNGRFISGTRDQMMDVAADQLRKAERAHLAKIADETEQLVRDITRGTSAEFPIAKEAGQLSLADIQTAPTVERFAGEPTAMTGRLEFGRSPALVAAERQAALSGVREAQLAREGEAIAAARAAEREAVMRGGLPPERITEPVSGPLALRPGVRMEDVIAAEEAAAAQGLRLGQQMPAPEVGPRLLGARPVYPMPGRAAPQLGGAPLPSGAANTALRDALVAQREAASTPRLPGRRPTIEDLQARALQDAMAARDMQATNELRAAVEAERAAGVPPERALTLAGPEASAERYVGSQVPPEPPGLGAPSPEYAAGPLSPERLSLGAPAGALAAPEGAAALPAAAGLALQGAVYSGASQAQRQQLGLEEGGAAEIALATALGGALPLGLTALGRGFKAASRQVAGAVGSNGLPLGQKFVQAMERLEETQLLRTFGLNKGQIQALIGQLKDDGLGRRGARQFADFVKAEFARLEQLKMDPRFVDNEVLQSIKTDGVLKFGNLRPEQRVAFSDAVRTFYGQLVEKLYEPAAGVRISNDELSAALGAIRSQAMRGVKGLGDIPMKSIQSEFDAFSRFVADPANTHTVASLREFEKRLSDSFRQTVGANNEFTPAQRAFRDIIKDLYVSKLDQAVPGASLALKEANGAYSIANKMFEGARDLEAKLAQTSPLGRDQLSQFILGAAALNSPIAAAKFLIMGAALRGFYNQRGEGALADMAAKLAGNGIRALQNPQKAGAIAARSLFDAERAVLYPLNAQRLVSVTPGEYTELANSVRDMAKNREDVAKQVMAATAGLPPEKQQQVMQKFDRIFQALGDALPDNLETPGKVSEQARRYTVFARSMLDEAYATQVMANGGPEAQLAADALKAQGEDGQKYIDTLEADLRNAINADRKAQDDAQLLAAYRSIKSFSRKGGLRATGGLGRFIHGGGGLRLPSGGGSVNQMSPTQVSKAVNAFSGIGGMKQ